ncbi:MAG: hypothetical protein K0S12_512 [Bacteroidetes bacterium]|jgi:hypothetical protein|nr:hypothetical protein [Bacteroidota bacterium]
MSDDKTKIRPQDASRINLNEEYEIQYWTKKLNCSREELEQAVKAVGSSAENVQKFLR